MNFEEILQTTLEKEHSMAQKRKTEASVSNSDQDKPNLALNFQNAANELTKLYHQALNFEKIAFDAGQKHSLMKAYEWVSSQNNDGKTVTSSDVIAYVQNELNGSLPIPHHQLSEAQGSGLNQSQTSRNANIESTSDSSCSDASMRNREPGCNVPSSQVHDMEEDRGYV